MTNHVISWNVYRKNNKNKLVFLMTIYTKYAVECAQKTGFIVKIND